MVAVWGVPPPLGVPVIFTVYVPVGVPYGAVMVNVTVLVGLGVGELTSKLYFAWLGRPDTCKWTVCGLLQAVRQVMCTVMCEDDPPTVIAESCGLAVNANVNCVPELPVGGTMLIVTLAVPWIPWLLMAVSAICTEPESENVISASQYPEYWGSGVGVAFWPAAWNCS